MDEARREVLREATVDVVRGLRDEYLAIGASPLKHWTQIQERMRSAARMSTDVPTWVTAVSRGLTLGAPKATLCVLIQALRDAVGEDSTEWLDLIEEEHAYLIAMTRLSTQKRKAERDAKREGHRTPKTDEPSDATDQLAF